MPPARQDALLDEPMREHDRDRPAQREARREGDMRKRWAAAGMLVAEQQFRRIIGYRHLAALVVSVERHGLRTTPPIVATQEAAELVTV
jgi:hypothetical protein